MMTSIELKCAKTGAYFQVYLKNIDSKGEKVHIEYPDHWRSDEWVTPDRIRCSAPPYDVDEFKPKVSETIEVLLRNNSDEPCSWWEAEIKTNREQYYMVCYESGNHVFNEIVEKEFMRPRNPNLSLTAEDFVKKVIKIPQRVATILPTLIESLKDDAMNQSQSDKKNEDWSVEDEFSRIQFLSGCMSLVFDFEKMELVAIGNRRSLKKVDFLCRMTFENFKEMVALRERARRIEQEIADLDTRLREASVVEFTCDPELIGLVIGKKGENIRSAEKLEGVLHISVKSASGAVSIVAQDQESALKAREMLEYVKEKYPVPREQMGRIVGERWSKIREIIEDTGVLRINALNNTIRPVDEAGINEATREWGDPDADMTYLVIIGTKETVINAKALLSQHVKNVQEMQEVMETYNNTQYTLNQLSMESGEGRYRGDDMDDRNRDVIGGSVRRGRGRGNRGRRGGGRGRGRGGGGRGGGRGRRDHRYGNEWDVREVRGDIRSRNNNRTWGRGRGMYSRRQVSQPMGQSLSGQSSMQRISMTDRNTRT